MNNSERDLLHYVCVGDIKKSQEQAKIILTGLSTKKDEAFRDNMLRKLETQKSLIELPYNLRGLLIAEDVSIFPTNRFILRTEEQKIVTDVLNALNVSQQLSELGIPYLPALILYGESGGGKTMLARYIAHVTELPFIYVRFSGVVDSRLGGTQSNIAKIFDYAKSFPCVLCFDEMDAVSMSRGQNNDVGEMSRISIAMMQELDMLQNNTIVIGTTNRYDQLDPAIIRRFTMNHEVLPLDRGDIRRLADKFLRYAGINIDSNLLDTFCNSEFKDSTSAATVVTACTKLIVSKMIAVNKNVPTERQFQKGTLKNKLHR